MASSSPKWFYAGNKDTWYPFEPRTQAFLESKKQANAQKCKLTINNELYDIDLEKMKQTKRSDPTRVRKIKREISPSQPILTTVTSNPMLSPFATTAAPSVIAQIQTPPVTVHVAPQVVAVAAATPIVVIPTKSQNNVVAPATATVADPNTNNINTPDSSYVWYFEDENGVRTKYNEMLQKELEKCFIEGKEEPVKTNIDFDHCIINLKDMKQTRLKVMNVIREPISPPPHDFPTSHQPVPLSASTGVAALPLLQDCSSSEKWYYKEKGVWIEHEPLIQSQLTKDFENKTGRSYFIFNGEPFVVDFARKRQVNTKTLQTKVIKLE
ncbi:uncharacterized protein LOC135940962 [Cloeon dipterum]|uniref:uncharacterized protein LOC135940962 n=1 Tax=Cloeon dipterum TaxID=197152 RepID=UPI00321F84B7